MLSFLWRFPWRLQLQLQKGGARGYNGLITSSNDDVNFSSTDIHGLSEEVSLPDANVNHTSKEYGFIECNIKNDIRQACHGESDQKSWLRTFATKSGHAEQKCATAGLNKDRVQEIREIPNGKKPSPEEYLCQETIDFHLQKFEANGCYKFVSSEPKGILGENDGVFVTTGTSAKKALAEANGDPRKLEEFLGMPKGYLGDDPYIVRVDNPQNLRMPTGNETNAWQDRWCPGGTTVGGVDEALVDPVNADDYSYKPCFRRKNE